MNDELADRIEALEAERLRPVPPASRTPLRPVDPVIAREHRKALFEATRPRTAGRRPSNDSIPRR